MIDFDLAPNARRALRLTRELNLKTIRRITRYYDEHEHAEIRAEDIREIEEGRKAIAAASSPREGERFERSALLGIIIGEEQNWGDPAVSMTATNSFVGNMVIGISGTPEQKAHAEGKYAAFCMTEPCCGSDTAAIQTTAELDKKTNEWVLNGEKIFVTGGRRCELAVVWASLDRSLGRAAMKPFLVDKGTPGMTVTKLELKMGFRASDTAAIVFDNCRIPYENIIGSPEIMPKAGSGSAGFASAMKTFDGSRPMVAATALGIGQAALDFAKEILGKEGLSFPYDKGRHELTAVQKDILDMEAGMEVARLLVWRSAAMLDTGERNSLEASMGKSKAGRTATLVTQKCVELLGPMGYSKQWLAEKFMRDSKITDIFEGTGQINLLIIARAILGYSRGMLK